MKRIYYYITLLTLAITPVMLSSCDDDDFYYSYDTDYYDYVLDLSQTLNGTWTGTLTDTWKEDGKWNEESMYVDFTFTQNTPNSKSGVGTEIDYDGNGNYSEPRYFSWYVDNNANIIVSYTASGYRYILNHDGNSKLSGFSLSKDNFSGVMERTDGYEFHTFNCRRATAYGVKGKTPQTWADETLNRTFGKATMQRSINTAIALPTHNR